VLALTAGVDVGDYGLNYEVVGWGKGKENWGIEYGIIDGDPRQDDVWGTLDDLVYKRLWLCADGKSLRVHKVAVDSGYASDYVYAYTKPRQPRAIAVRGEGGLGKPFVKGAGTFAKSNRARIVTLGVDSGKEEIVIRLRVGKPGPGYCHFPKLRNGEPARGYDEEYFKGLTAESRVVKSQHGFRTYIWIKRLSQRNEPFDCRNYAMAALALSPRLKLDTMPRDLWLTPKTTTSGPSTFGAQQMTDQPVAAKATTMFGVQNRPLH